MWGQGRRRWGLVVAAVVASVVLVVAPGRSVESGGEFVPLAGPVRLLDTRPGSATVDGQFAGIGLRPAGSSLQLDVAGRAGLPADAASVVLNVTAVDAEGWGYVTAHASGTARPNASNLNYDVGQTIANTVITPVGSDGDVVFFTHAATHLLVDAIGYLPTDAFDALPAAARLLDTRPGSATVDGNDAGIGRRAAGSTIDLDVAGRAGIPDDATSVVLNVTATAPEGWGFVTVHPTGTGRPNASNLNYDRADTIANTVVTRLGADGQVSIYTYAATHLIVDVAGHLPATSFTPLPAPARILDTRLGAATADGQQAGTGLRPASSSVQLNVAGRAGLPADASSVVLNVTAVDALGWGFVTEFPTGAARPNASNLNYDAGSTNANTDVARLGAGGDVCIYTYWATHLIVDVIGHLPGPLPPAAGPTCPPMKYGSPKMLTAGSTLSDINNAGIMVGAVPKGENFTDAAWWPTPDGDPQLLPGVPDDAWSSTAFAINDRSEVLIGAFFGSAGSRTFVVDLASGRSAEFPGLDGVPGLEGLDALARDLNDRGEVLFEVLRDEEGVDAVAIWDSNTGVVETHVELTSGAYGSDINDLGHVVGYLAGIDSGDAYYWDRDADILHRLDRQDFRLAGAESLNNRGQIIGSVSDGTHGGRHLTVLWSHRDAAPAALLGNPAVGKINEAGIVLGQRLTADRLPAPWVWDSVSGQVIEFPSVFGYSAFDINDAGQVIGSTGHKQPALWDPV